MERRPLAARLLPPRADNLAGRIKCSHLWPQRLSLASILNQWEDSYITPAAGGQMTWNDRPDYIHEE